MKLKQSISTRVFAAAVAVASTFGCGNPTTKQDPTIQTTPTGGFDGVDEAQQNLTPLATACAFVADGGIVNVALSAGEYALIAGNADGGFFVNGTACGTALTSAVTRINVTGSADGGNETVILDYLGGAFAMGTLATPGINIDLKAGTDAVKIRGTSGVDLVQVATVAADAGTSGVYAIALGLNGSATGGKKSITFNNVESLVVSTGPGDDSIFTNGQADGGIGGTPFGKAGSGSGPTLVVYGGDNNDTLNMGIAKGGAVTFNGGLGTDVADYSARTANLSITIGGGAVCGESGEGNTIATDVDTIEGGSGSDTLVCDATAACTLNGNAGADSLTGGGFADTLNGGAGDDVLVGGQGSDTIVGGTGTDTVSYSDRVTGQDVDITLGAAGAAQTGNGEQTVADGGMAENDSIATCENIVGGAGDDTVQGNDVDNQITGGAGDDTLSGGAGNDTFFMSTSAATCGDDTIDGEAGDDTVSYAQRTAALTLTLTTSTPSTGNGESGEAGSLVNVENLICGSAADTVTGDSANNVIEGGAGNDTISSGGGDDTIDPGAGTNTVTCGGGSDILLPGGTTTNAANDCEG